ncbi:MAG: hypothetical protein WB402_04775, partial [Sulfuricaulis sp.]
QEDGIRTVSHADAVLRAAERRERRLECLDEGTSDEGGFRDDVRDRLVDLVLDALVLRFQVDQRDIQSSPLNMEVM